MKKSIRRLVLLLGVGGFGLILLASIVRLDVVSIIGIAMLVAAVVIALMSAFRGGNGNDTGSYRIPRT